jgi:hypothetical protein
MKKLFSAITICFLALTFTAGAQSSPAPDNYVLKTKEDYAKYQEAMLKTVDWLQNASWSEPLDNRKPSNAFVMDWLSGSPDVSISVGSPLMKLASKNPELILIYMGNYAKYALQHKTDFNKTQADLVGVKAMIDKYSKESAHKKDSAMEKVVKLDKDGKLEDWVKSDFEKS